MMVMKTFFAATLSLFSAATAHAQVERGSFDTSPFALGILTEQDGALPRDLWEGADAASVAELLVLVPTRFDDPTKRLILRRVLLSPGNGPVGADTELAALKLQRASDAGYAMEAAALAELTPGLPVQPELSRVVATRDLLRGQIDQACNRGANLREGRQQSFFVKLRALCYIHAGERPAAELTLDLAGEEGVLTPTDARMFDALLSGDLPSRLPETALQYAVYRKLYGLFTAEDVERVPPSIAAAIALDRSLSAGAREAALYRVATEDLLGYRDLTAAALMLDESIIRSVVSRVQTQPEGSSERAMAIGEALRNAQDEPASYLLRTKIFSADIGSIGLTPESRPYAVEYALASLLLRRFSQAERWMQIVAEEQTIGAERAFLNLSKLYSYQRPSAAQRLAGAIGERIPDAPVPSVSVEDRTAALYFDGSLEAVARRGVAAAASGSEAAMLLAGLQASAVEGQASVRDALGTALFEAGGAETIASDAAFQEAALAYAGRLRADTINAQPFIPRLKPSSESR